MAASFIDDEAEEGEDDEDDEVEDDDGLGDDVAKRDGEEMDTE
jgi:hypothetical protein